MRARCSRRFGMALVATLLTGCAGGRGSSGFDVNAENAAITAALTMRQCVEFDGLMICPANEFAGSTPVASPSPSPTATPPGPTPTSPTPTPGVLTPTAVPNLLPHVDTTISSTGSIDCIQEPNGACRFSFTFTPSNFAATAGFRVAARDAGSNGAWHISTVPVAAGDSAMASLNASVVVEATHGGAPALVQFAVLVFPMPRQSLPLEIQTLAQAGADSAFVTQPLTVTILVSPPSSDTGPQVTYVGIARADHVPVAPVALDTDGRPVYLRTSGQGMTLVVEARPGADGARVGTEVYDPAGGLPDLQIIVSRPLGDGSTAVCDAMPPHAGGVPATDPLAFSDLPALVDAINDLGCRADGAGRASSAAACTTPDATTGEFAFVDPTSTIQYCVPIAVPWAFAAGDTVVAARVRDAVAQVSVQREIVVRVVPRTPQ